MNRPVASTNVLIKGPDTNAGSTPMAEASSGSSEPTEVDQKTMTPLAIPMVRPKAGSPSPSQARRKPATAMIKPVMSPALASCQRTLIFFLYYVVQKSFYLRSVCGLEVHNGYSFLIAGGVKFMGNFHCRFYVVTAVGDYHPVE